MSEKAKVPVYAIAQGRTVNRALHDEYVAKALPGLEKHGVKILSVTETPEVIEGKIDNPRFVLLEFPSHDAFRAWYDSPEYRKILPMRLEAVPGSFVVIEGRPQSA
jgi:uncharacterized protein (DUF1330 family)